MRLTDEDVYVLRLDKDGERYVFFYTEDRKSDVLRRLTEWAANPDLSFSWHDAARLSHEIRHWK